MFKKILIGIAVSSMNKAVDAVQTDFEEKIKDEALRQITKAGIDGAQEILEAVTDDDRDNASQIKEALVRQYNPVFDALQDKAVRAVNDEEWANIVYDKMEKLQGIFAMLWDDDPNNGEQITEGLKEVFG